MAILLNDCGCCEGITAIVPEPLFNRAGLSQVGYRMGLHGDFLASALAALSDPQFGALRSLTTRDLDDFTIALLDGWATLADVFTFYQERIANELWLRTASERDSILRLAQLIGYRLRPGVAAETLLSFLLDDTSGAPDKVMVEIGTKVQSVPGAGEKPRTFETIEELDARVEWNALQPALTTPAIIGPTSLYLKGTSTNLQPGNLILIITSGAWMRKPLVLLAVTPDHQNNRTKVEWQSALDAPLLGPAGLGPLDDVLVFALRQRAALFGHNAPDWKSIPKSIRKAYDPPNGTASNWPGFKIQNNQIDLDNVYPKVVPDSWVVLLSGSSTYAVYKATSVSFPSRADFALSGKVTRITPDTQTLLNSFELRETIVYAESEQLEMASGPLITPAAGSIASALTRDPDLLAPIEGSVINLDRLIPPLEPVRKVIITGKLLRARVAADSLPPLTSADGSQPPEIKKGDSVTLIAVPTLLSGNSAKFPVRTDEGFEGTIQTDPGDLILTAAAEKDPAISELATVHECSGEPSTLTLEAPLTHLFDRATVAIAANIADATHGETVTEVLGGGDGSQPNQSFKLKQTPALTYTRSTAPGGAESTLQIRVNDLLWHEVPTLFEREPRERIFTTELADDGTVTVRFGDGIRGARLPSGTQNLKATYRRGIGLDGLVRAGQLSMLLTRPPGLKSAINPLAAEGADDPESFANARQNAPLTVLTLDRVVSLEDYENFSRAYAGIAKALATWTWDGRTRGVFITVAGPLGAEISDTLVQDLTDAIHDAGDPFVPVRVASYVEALFLLSGQIIIDPDYETDKVLTAAEDALRAEYSFEKRSFGQPVMLSEVIALVQGVAGVVAVNITKLYRSDDAAIGNVPVRLEAQLPTGGDPASLSAAELLILDPAPIDLEVIP
jgi:conserved hypothetical protein, phage tail-like region